MLLLLAFLALLASAAHAGDNVLVVDGDRIFERFDPALPPDTQRLPDAHPVAVPSKGPSVKRSVETALARKEISKGQHDRYLELYTLARRTRADKAIQLRCRTQLDRVLDNLSSISRRGKLSGSRMYALFLQLRRNVEFWSKEPSIRVSKRVTFSGTDPVIYQHYRGQGIQIQPLGNFGRANGLWQACKGEKPGEPCEPQKLRELLDSLLKTASRRAGMKTWEYWFPFGGGSPPWVSGLAQGTAVQGLARAAVYLGEPRYMEAARQGISLFKAAPPAGVRVRSRGGYHYLIYSFAPRLRVLNGFLQAVTGLHDYARLARDRTALTLFRRGDHTARREVPLYDTGKWSLYARPGSESTYDYHVLVTGFLQNLCQRTHARVYCRFAKRFATYAKRRGAPPSGGGKGEGQRCGYL